MHNCSTKTRRHKVLSTILCIFPYRRRPPTPSYFLGAVDALTRHAVCDISQDSNVCRVVADNTSQQRDKETAREQTPDCDGRGRALGGGGIQRCCCNLRTWYACHTPPVLSIPLSLVICLRRVAVRCLPGLACKNYSMSHFTHTNVYTTHILV